MKGHDSEGRKAGEDLGEEGEKGEGSALRMGGLGKVREHRDRKLRP